MVHQSPVLQCFGEMRRRDKHKGTFCGERRRASVEAGYRSPEILGRHWISHGPWDGVRRQAISINYERKR